MRTDTRALDSTTSTLPGIDSNFYLYGAGFCSLCGSTRKDVKLKQWTVNNARLLRCENEAACRRRKMKRTGARRVEA